MVIYMQCLEVIFTINKMIDDVNFIKLKENAILLNKDK